ncbi:MAG: protein translocase subunit SecD [Armatimonadetes bacterium]|nr:protein translocase subunit SecD [Armatimonadota bacterium]
MRHKYYFLGIVLLVLASAWVIFFDRSHPTKLGLDLKGGMRVILRANPPPGTKFSPQNLTDAKRVIQNRVDAFGVSEPLVQTKGNDQIVVELPDIPAGKRHEALAKFQQLAMLRFVKIPEKYNVEFGEPVTFRDRVTQEEVPASQILKEGEEIVTGRELEPGKAVGNIMGDGSTVVELYFNGDGRKKFADFTRKNVKKYFGIFLDDVPISVPIVEEPIPGGNGVIRGSFSLEEAQDLANLLNAGALPVPLQIDQTTDVGATLGKESVDKSIIAGIVGLILVALYMVAYYRLPGVIAVVALIFYSAFLFALFRLIPVTLTLPGIAGFILSIGMAVDANILIFERLKEELNAGKTLRAAIETGFSRAFPSIFDSNACTLITCFVLYNFGTGPIRGFAVVLAIGVLVSMFTAITCTRNMLYLLVGTGLSQKPNLWGLGRSWLHRDDSNPLQIVERKKVYFTFSGAVILVGILAMGYLLVTKGSIINRGIDFTGGSLLQIRYEEKLPATSDIRKALEGVGRGESQVATMPTENRVTIRGKEFPADANQAEAVRSQIEKSLQSTGKFQVEAVDNVGPVMGKELTLDAIKAVILASLLIIVYLAFRFSGIDFGVTAVMALVHDVLILLGLFALAGIFSGWQVDSLFVTAALTVIGFSVHDTIVVFDRIRENMKHRQRGESFDLVANKSVTQTLARSINTSGTVIVVLVALVALGGGTILQFNMALLIGIMAGTYSSIFTATPLLSMWRAYERRQAQVAARKPDEKPMVGARPRPAKPTAPGSKPTTVTAAGDGEVEEARVAAPAQGRASVATARPSPGGVAKAAPKPQRNIKKKKRRY